MTGEHSSDQIMREWLAALLDAADDLVHGLGCECDDPDACAEAREQAVCNAARAYVVELSAWELDGREARRLAGIPEMPRHHYCNMTPAEAAGWSAEMERVRRRLEP